MFNPIDNVPSSRSGNAGDWRAAGHVRWRCHSPHGPTCSRRPHLAGIIMAHIHKACSGALFILTLVLHCTFFSNFSSFHEDGNTFFSNLYLTTRDRFMVPMALVVEYIFQRNQCIIFAMLTSYFSI